jgi:Rha family phage regulatory protein
MTQLIPSEKDYGVITLDGVAVVNSRKIAEIFHREHKTVLEAIRSCECSAGFRQQNLLPSSYKNEQGKKQPEYLLTKNGFALIVMGFTGRKAIAFKEAYINRFDQMEQFIKSRNLAKLDYPELTDMIRLMHDEPKFYHFSNEADMINRIVLGMSAKKYREQLGLPKDAPLREHLAPWQIEAIQKLQKVDIGMVVAIPEFGQRKEALTNYFKKLTQPRLAM